MIKNLLEDLRFLPRKYKKLLMISLDVILILVSSILCEFLLVGYITPISRSLVIYIFIVSVLLVLIFLYKDNYSFATRYFDTDAISSIFLASILLIIILYILGKILSFRYFSENFIITQNLIFILLTISVRIFFKYLLYQHSFQKRHEIKNLIFGASFEGIKFLKQNKNLKDKDFVGFIDEDINKIGTIIENLKVYSIAEIKLLLKKYKISTIYMCSKSISQFKRNELESIFENYNIKLEHPIIDQNNFFKDDNNIDFGDYENYFDGKKILITGCAGSIGQEIFLSLINLKVKKIIGLDKNEETIAALKINLKKNKLNNDKYELKLFDVCNIENCNFLLKEEKFDIVFHAAAYKHVDIVEENPTTAIFNNIIGLHNIIDSSAKNGVDNFVFVSTDKAVNPSNIMGSTKRYGELIVKFYKKLSGRKYISVRFGNVIGSSGSLLQILKKQLVAGGPITLTHPEATRYFMTIKEAVSLVLKSTTLNDNGDIYVLKMGDPINIYKLMKDFLKNNNSKEKTETNDGIEIKTIGLRPGEKLHEELFYNDAKSTSTPTILKENITKEMNDLEINNLIAEIKLINSENLEKINKKMKTLIDGFAQ